MGNVLERFRAFANRGDRSAFISSDEILSLIREAGDSALAASAKVAGEATLPEDVAKALRAVDEAAIGWPDDVLAEAYPVLEALARRASEMEERLQTWCPVVALHDADNTIDVQDRHDGHSHHYVPASMYHDLQAKLAAISLAAIDADIHCWGPGFASPEAADAYARRLRILAQPNADRSNTAWLVLDAWREEGAKVHTEVSRLVSLVIEAYQAKDPREVLSRIVEIAPDGLPRVNLGSGMGER